MSLKDAKNNYGISSTYFYKLKAKAESTNIDLDTLLKEYVERKENNKTKKAAPKKDEAVKTAE